MAIEDFIEQAFDENGFKETEHQPIKNDNCKYCPFHKTHLCSATYWHPYICIYDNTKLKTYEW